jgi:CheY-like chemotaxis protein
MPSARFFLELPHRKRGTRGNHILLWVDDDWDEIAVVMRAFKRAKIPIDVRVASDGLEALQALHLGGTRTDATPLRPQVIFVDLHMPRIDGFELLRALRELPETRDIPIVVVSSSNSPEDIPRSYELGANSYLSKSTMRSSRARQLQMLRGTGRN